MSIIIHNLCLSDLDIGDIASVKGFSTDEIPIKLYDMGLIPGSKVSIYTKAPFNGPICISIGMEESLLALRSSEAKIVMVEKIK